MTTKTGPGGLLRASNVNTNMEKMFLPWLAGRSWGYGVRRALTPIHLSAFISPSLPHTSPPSIFHMRHTHLNTLKMIHLHTHACADVERVRASPGCYTDKGRIERIACAFTLGQFIFR